MRKNYFFLFALIIALCTFSFDIYNLYNNANEVYPNKTINGYIAWGAGGATDNASRSITPLAEKYLGQSVVLQNKTGATGAIATQFVYDEKSDGYSLLYNAENPAVYGVMGISNIDYDMFEPIIIIGREIAVMIVNADSEYNSIEDVITYAKDHDGEIKLGTSGVGGLPFNVASMISTTSHVTFNQIPFDGDGPILSAMLGGHVDIAIVNLSAATELEKSGDIKIIGSMTNDRVEGFPNVPPIGEVYEEYQKYFPWGAFYGVYVKKDCPEDVKDTLKAAYKNAYDEEDYQKYLENSHIVPMGISGQEAKDYIEKWQQVSSWLLYEAGVTVISPAELGISKVS